LCLYRYKKIMLMSSGIICFLLSTLIYILFRPTSLLLFHWINYFGFMDKIFIFRSYFSPVKDIIPFYLIYSIPFGLWVISYMTFIKIIWCESKSYSYDIFFWSVPIISFISEMFQYFGVISGTFDLTDLVILGITIILGFIIKNI